jgi:ABC-type polysaccharide/polyol phosphate export permease
VTTLAGYRRSRELFANLTLRELRAKYKRSFLGWAWSMVNPLANMAVYTLVFKYFFHARLTPGRPSGLNVYSLFLLSAMLPWNYFQTSVLMSISSLVGNANLIKKTYFPRDLLPAANVAATLVSHAIEMGLLLVALLAFGNYRALEELPFVVLLILLLALFSLGVGLMLSVLNVYFRDIQHFVNIFFMVWFYMTPIIYPITFLHSHIRTIMKLNPMTDMALGFQATLYDGTHPGWIELGYFAAWAVAVFLIGRKVFDRLEGRLAEEL